MNTNAEESYSVGVWSFVLGVLLRMFSQPLSEAFFGRSPSEISAWSSHAALPQISLLMMVFGGVLIAAAFWADKKQ